MKQLFLSTTLLVGLGSSVSAGDLAVIDSYARAASPAAKSGAAFLVIENTGEEDDQLIGAASDIAMRVELHTHVMEGDVMRMVEVEEGFAVPAGGTLEMQRGAEHVMLMGLNRPMADGDIFEVVLTFEKAGEMVLQVEVDLDR